MRSKTVVLIAAALLPGCSYLGGLSGSGGNGAADVAMEAPTGSTAPAQRSQVSLSVRSKPLDAYVLIGGNIKRCWFNPTDPLLPKHVYRADVSPNGSTVKITVHQRIELGRAGVTTYVIDFRQSGPSTIITTENRKMPPELAAKMEFDLNRWRRGESDCSKDMPTTAAIPASPGPAPAPATRQPLSR